MLGCIVGLWYTPYSIPAHSGPKGGIIEKLTDPESEMVVKYPTQIYWR